MSKEYNIAVLKGDGIGPEIINEAVKVLNCTSAKYGFKMNYSYCLIGGIAIDETGVSLPEETIDVCRKSDAVLMGAVGGPKWDRLDSGETPETGLLGIRKALGLFANLRPAITFDELKSASPLRQDIIGDNLDIMIVRELSGGIYFGEKGGGVKNKTEYAFDTEMYTLPEIRRIARLSFDLSMKRKKKLCSVDKANVLRSSKLWRRTVTEMSKDFPEVELSHMYVDNCAMKLIKSPACFDVILTSNMFGDILSDEASMISGSIGMLPSASLSGDTFGLYEPVHGSAPDIQGLGISNPLAAILSAAMMLEHSLNERSAAKTIEVAVDGVLRKARTADIFEYGYQKVGTSQMGELVMNQINSLG